MKLYAYTKDNDYICSFAATLEKDGYKKLFKKFKKMGLVEKAYLRIDENNEKGIKKAIEKLNIFKAGRDRSFSRNN